MTRRDRSWKDKIRSGGWIERRRERRETERREAERDDDGDGEV